MAKKKHDTGIAITTPSAYGSHSSMVVKDLGNGKVICKDDLGEYETFVNRLDNGTADPLRFSRVSEV